MFIKLAVHVENEQNPSLSRPCSLDEVGTLENA